MSLSFNRGFTLIEMLVVVAIVVIISTVTLLNFPQFSASQQLQITAQDVLTTMRETQLYGIAVRGETATTTTTGTETVYKSQGVYINPSFVPSQNNGAYFMTYIDADHVIGSSDGNEGFNRTDCKTDSPDNDNDLAGPCLVKPISPPIRATRFCVSYDNSTERCSDDATAPITAIDILFQRPEPEPKIWGFNASGRIVGTALYATMTLEAVTDTNVPIDGTGIKTVQIYNTGQISIKEEVAARPRSGK
jgi:prepilin-type N-terminal cleavage/methylation domain-containing protein